MFPSGFNSNFKISEEALDLLAVINDVVLTESGFSGLNLPESVPDHILDRAELVELVLAGLIEVEPSCEQGAHSVLVTSEARPLLTENDARMSNDDSCNFAEASFELE